MVKKKEKYSKWLRRDYAIVLGLFLVVEVVANFATPLLFPGESFAGGGFAGGMARGLVIGVVYHFTLRRLWVRRYPDQYRQYVCSRCDKVVSKEASVCLTPRCNAQFED